LWKEIKVEKEEKTILYDRDIREPLFEFLEEMYGKIRIIQEKNMGKSRADVVAVLDDTFCGIEIKSDADTYTRLKRQVADYDKYFDYNYVVVGSSHAMHIEEHVPEYWGIITVENTGEKTDFYVLKKPEKNPNINMQRKLSLLWRPELAHIQELNGMAKYKNNSKQFVIEKILAKVPCELLQKQMSDELFERDYDKIADIINSFRIENNQKPRRRRKYRRVKRT
jgi:hypothetical protein